MKHLYALLAGINDYTAPIPKLKGCIKDLDQIEGFLREHCSESHHLHILRLDDAAATYDNVMKGFREHLGAAGPEDIVWFHFSGHGSEERTATEFLALEPNGKDQTLLCYDSGINGVPHIADKELAVLLYELATKHAAGAPHILVSLDCCHSGSGTRDAAEDIAMTARAVPSRGATRSLDSYAGGYYARQARLEVPSARHLLLSACKSIQTAGDLPQGGAFTTGLVKALRHAKGNLSYTDLFLRTRASVQQIRDNQTPQFEALHHFDPYTRFLDGSPAGERDLYEVVRLNGEWYVRCGAIHGLPTAPAEPIMLDIYDAPPDKELLGSAAIRSVGAQLSRIDLEGSFGMGHFFRKLTSDDTAYRAALRHLPAPPEPARLTGDPALVGAVRKGESMVSRYVSWTPDGEPASIEVHLDDAGVTVSDLVQSRKAFVTDGNSPDHLRTVSDALDKIVLWRRFIALENQNRGSKIASMVQYELQEIDENGGIKKHMPGHVRIYASSQSLANRIPSFVPVVHLQNIRQPLCFYLFFVAFDYSIACPGGEIIYRPSEHDDTSHIGIPLWKKSLGWGPAKDHTEDTCHFKLLVTTEPLDYQQFLQGGLGVHRDILGEPTPERVFDDWAAFDIAVTMVRQDDDLSPSRDVTLAGGAVRVKAHPSMAGQVSAGHVESNARGAGSLAAFAGLQRHHRLVDFSPAGSTQAQNIIEIHAITTGDTGAPEQDPLEIALQHTPEEHDMILPVAFDGTWFRVIGDAEPDAAGTHVLIDEIPGSDIPESEEAGERSLLRSLKMTFCKVALGQQEVNRLRWAERNMDGAVSLQEESLGIRIGRSKHILLVLHGLGSDGQTMTQSLYDLLPREIMERYDTVLVYDYESLNTPLDETAAALYQTLADYGFGQDGRHVTIISHSIGGLVARWMIEQLGGNAFVDHCVLAGVPNNGTMYGRVDAYAKYARTALDIAINFIPQAVPFAALLTKAFKTASTLGVSLTQLDPRSPFINKLNSSRDPGTRYTVISGDASGLDVPGSGYEGFMQKAAAGLGKWTTGDEPNDLFAPVRSQQCRELWEGRHTGNIVHDPVAGHHFSYFNGAAISDGRPSVKKLLAEALRGIEALERLE